MGVYFWWLDNIQHAKRPHKVAKTYVRKVYTNSTLLKHKKCICATPIGILLGHVVYKEGIKVDIAKSKVIIDLKPPINPKQIRIFLGNIGYYRKFIRHYYDITYHMEELLRIDVPYH